MTLWISRSTCILFEVMEHISIIQYNMCKPHLITIITEVHLSIHPSFPPLFHPCTHVMNMCLCCRHDWRRNDCHCHCQPVGSTGVLGVSAWRAVRGHHGGNASGRGRLEPPLGSAACVGDPKANALPDVLGGDPPPLPKGRHPCLLRWKRLWWGGGWGWTGEGGWGSGGRERTCARGRVSSRKFNFINLNFKCTINF